MLTLLFDYCLQHMEIKSLVCGLKWAKKVSNSFSNYALIILSYLHQQQSEGELIVLKVNIIFIEHNEKESV